MYISQQKISSGKMRGVPKSPRNEGIIDKAFYRRLLLAVDMIKKLFLLLLLFSGVSAPNAGAETFLYSAPDSVEGTVRTYRVRESESLIEIARKFGLGFNEIREANPFLDPFVPGDGATVVVPTSWILPVVEPPEGIFINLSELRLYYFYKQKGERFVVTFPIGIGSEGNDTPLGKYKIIEKIVNPAWHVPASIRKEKPDLPAVVPAGPDNPLGSHALRLSEPTILLHGTNKPWGIGRTVSHGCIRLYPEDIPRLFALVPYGARVTILRQPIKVGVRDNRVYMEVHDDPHAEPTFGEAINLLRKKGVIARADIRKMYMTLEKRSGVPTDITK
jgi:L,D-transpeptidase ErfK/SrfK